MDVRIYEANGAWTVQVGDFAAYEFGTSKAARYFAAVVKLGPSTLPCPDRLTFGPPPEENERPLLPEK